MVGLCFLTRRKCAHDCMDAGGRAKQDARAEKRSLHVVNEHSSTFSPTVGALGDAVRGHKTTFYDTLKYLVPGDRSLPAKHRDTSIDSPFFPPLTGPNPDVRVPPTELLPHRSYSFRPRSYRLN